VLYKMNKINKFFLKLYYYLFIERFQKKIKYKFPKNYYRWDMINYFIKKKNYKNYLEIGCDENHLFSKVQIHNKVGVDPIKGGNIRMTSDQFFKKNKKKFDLIFIDGLHIYKQVKRDIINSIKCLNKNGIILVHDCLPDSISKQAVPRFRKIWNGDVWKAITDLRQNKNLEIFTCEIDQGIGIIQKKKNTSILKIKKNIKKLKFRDFFYNYKLYLRIISLSEFKKLF